MSETPKETVSDYVVRELAMKECGSPRVSSSSGPCSDVK
jgi:hypothetical protein